MLAYYKYARISPSNMYFASFTHKRVHRPRAFSVSFVYKT